MGTLAGDHPAIIVRSCRVCGGAGRVCAPVVRAAGLDAPATFAALLDARGPSCPETNAQRLYVQQFTAVRWIGDTRGRLAGRGRKYPPRGYLACYGVRGSRGRWAACVYGLGLVCWHTSCAGRASKQGNLAHWGALPARGHAVLWKAVTLATSRNLKAARSIQL